MIEEGRARRTAGGVAARWKRYFDLSARLGPLRRVHALSTAGDAFTTVALAGSLFFSISPEAAKGKVILYLLLTMAPFGVVAPLLGPLFDRRRSSRRQLVAISLLARAVISLLMASNLHSLLLFPLAFSTLVASKSYLVAKAAIVPEMAGEGTGNRVRPRFLTRGAAAGGNPALVAANSEISLLAAAAGFLGGALAVAILKLPDLGSPWVLRVGALVFLLGGMQVRHLRLNTPRPAPEQEESEDGAAVRKPSPPSVLLAAAAMSVLRGSVGFFTFFIAFTLRRAHAPTYEYGLILAASALGSALATTLTPKIRRVLQEEMLLIFALVLEAGLGILGAAVASRAIQVGLAATIGFVASSGKLAFDSLVQYNVPAERQGKAFASFETRFQLSWVAGALVPTIVALPLSAGDLTLAFTAVVAATSFSAGRRAMRAA
ncbi:MAG: MFS transporter [Actinomycetota bacterium]|nr:MFS transporter [Actinomycetota bacterium]